MEGVLGCHSTGNLETHTHPRHLFLHPSGSATVTSLPLPSPGKGVCHVAGDPHYYTFDGVMHTFMGTCTYTLVEVRNNQLPGSSQ